MADLALMTCLQGAVVVLLYDDIKERSAKVVLLGTVKTFWNGCWL